MSPSSLLNPIVANGLALDPGLAIGAISTKSRKDARFRAPSPHNHGMRVHTGRFNQDEQVPPITSSDLKLPGQLTTRSSFQGRSQSSWPCAKDPCDSCRAGSLVFAGRSLTAGSEYVCEHVANVSSNSSECVFVSIIPSLRTVSTARRSQSSPSNHVRIVRFRLNAVPSRCLGYAQ